MPIYEYKCEGCGKDFEVIKLASDPEIKTCRYCQGPIRRMMSVSTFHLKGTGWYVTDYGGKKAPVCESEKSESKVEAKTDTADRQSRQKLKIKLFITK